MRRREFIAGVGSAVAWPVMARAQQGERTRRIGVLQPFAKDSPESIRAAAFVQELQRLGWTDGRNLQIEYRWESSDLRKAAMELVALSPEVILVSSTPAVSFLQEATRTLLSQHPAPPSLVRICSRKRRVGVRGHEPSPLAGPACEGSAPSAVKLGDTACGVARGQRVRQLAGLRFQRTGLLTERFDGWAYRPTLPRAKFKSCPRWVISGNCHVSE
jgi:hypothetical protein